MNNFSEDIGEDEEEKGGQYGNPSNLSQIS